MTVEWPACSGNDDVEVGRIVLSVCLYATQAGGNADVNDPVKPRIIAADGTDFPAGVGRGPAARKTCPAQGLFTLPVKLFSHFFFNLQWY